MIAKIYSIAPSGFSGALVEVEGDKNHGLPGFNIVGMANKTVIESRERIRSALTNSDFSFPTEKITINLAPADLQKDGTYLDLPIALSVLLLSNQLSKNDVKNRIFVGELSLEGSIRPVHGIINIVETAKTLGFQEVILPKQNLPQASLIPGIQLVGVDSLRELFLFLKGQVPPSPPQSTIVKNTKTPDDLNVLDNIHGQEIAKRALSIAVAGHHNILISGPPGSGKTALAHTAANLLPDLSSAEQISLTKLYSLNLSNSDIVSARPFRSPHHSASYASMLGGSSPIAPGEISLAHLGVLFLDELPEYPRAILEALRQPLEDHQITITRANSRVTFPADFMLIATMNPCPCGYYGDPNHHCSCTAGQILAYEKRLSGPLLDRVDIRINVQKVPIESLTISSSKTTKSALSAPNTAKKSASSTIDSKISEHDLVKTKISEALQRQKARYKDAYFFNSSLPSAKIASLLDIDPAAERLLRSAAEGLNLSARSFYKTVKVAQTIADFEGSDIILPEHITEALSYRTDQPPPII